MTAGYQEALAYLYDRIDYERTASVPDRWRGLNLERMRRLLDCLGNPHQRLRVLHLAGTKGKGSTATLISAILQGAGYRVGLYTSPHLERLEERLNVDGLMCGERNLVELVEALRPAVARCEDSESNRGGKLTFFELTTALAMLHFVRRAVDFAVLEVGMGGRLDSTNVCQPLISVITSISLDHTRQLGDTLAEIAAEKAGIIKPGVPVVSGVEQAEPRDVVRQVAASQGSRLFESGTDFTFQYFPPEQLPGELAHGRLSYREIDQGAVTQYDRLPLALLGRHQAANAAVALATVSRLKAAGYAVDEAAIRGGFETVRLPARVEIVSRCPWILVDTAHNVASARALAEVVREIRAVARRRVLIFAATRDKDVSGMLGELVPQFDRFIFTRFVNNPRGADPTELARLAAPHAVRAGRGAPDIQVVTSPTEAWRRYQADTRRDDLVCVTGSFFLAAELRRQIVEWPKLTSV